MELIMREWSNMNYSNLRRRLKLNEKQTNKSDMYITEFKYI